MDEQRPSKSLVVGSSPTESTKSVQKKDPQIAGLFVYI